nr:MAG TPA: hypothetical protein [Caudoviricetes sp.]
MPSIAPPARAQAIMTPKGFISKNAHKEAPTIIPRFTPSSTKSVF